MRDKVQISRRSFMGGIPGAGMGASKLGNHLSALMTVPPAISMPVGYIPSIYDEGGKDPGVSIDYFIERARHQAMRLAGGRNKKNLTPEQKQEIELLRLHNMQSANRLKSVSPAYANLMFLDEAERQLLRREEYYAARELETIKQQAGILGFLIPDNLLGDGT